MRWDDFTNHTPWGNSGFQFSDIILGSGSSLAEQIAELSVMPRWRGVFKNSQSNYWSPRIGFAWDPTKTGNWSVRGGVGVYRDWVVLGQSVDQMRLNPPSTLSETFTASQCSSSSSCSGGGIQPIFGLSPSGSYPYNFAHSDYCRAITLNAQGGNVGLPTNVEFVGSECRATLGSQLR